MFSENYSLFTAIFTTKLADNGVSELLCLVMLT